MDEYKMIDSKDIISLLSALISFYKKLARYIVSSVREYIVVAIIVAASIVGAKWYLWHSQVPVFESETTLYFNNLSRRSYGEMIQKLNVLVSNHSYVSLSKTLGISLDDAKSIISIEGKNVVGTQLYEDSSPGSSPIYIYVTSSSNRVFEPLQTGLVAYLNSSPYRSARNQMEIEAFNKKIEYIKGDIAHIDSVIQAYTTYIRNSSPMKDSTLNISKVTALLTYKGELEDKLTWTQSFKMKELEHSVEVFNGFAVPDNPTKRNGRFPWMIIPEAILISCLFCFALKLFLKAWKT